MVDWAQHDRERGWAVDLLDDADVRRSVLRWLAARTGDGAEALTSTDLLDFHYRGEPLRLMDSQRGIRKPAGLSAALSIRTVYRPEGRARPYDDSIGADGILRYKWRGDDPDHPENRAVRAAMTRALPLVWFFGVGAALYQAVFPVFVLAEQTRLQEFSLGIEAPVLAQGTSSAVEDYVRRYLVVETKRRLHQPVFRASVLRAYETHCAVCSLGHRELLDAAHIVPDGDDRGIAAVRNGLALCKIHHAAYDARILGVSPSYEVSIRADLLAETDGPMLRYGLQALHGQRLSALPRVRAERPDRELLDVTYRGFLAGDQVA